MAEQVMQKGLPILTSKGMQHKSSVDSTEESSQSDESQISEVGSLDGHEHQKPPAAAACAEVKLQVGHAEELKAPAGLPLNFYYEGAENRYNPFSLAGMPQGGYEVLLATSIISKGYPPPGAYVASEEKQVIKPEIKFEPECQTGIGFLQMVQTIIATQTIKKVNLLNTCYVQRHNKMIEALASGMLPDEAERWAKERVCSDWEEWTCQNKDALDLLRRTYGERFSIINVADIIESPKCKEYLTNIRKLYFNKFNHPEGDCRDVEVLAQLKKKFKRSINSMASFSMEHHLPDFVLNQFKSIRGRICITHNATLEYKKNFIFDECAVLLYIYDIYHVQLQVYRGNTVLPVIYAFEYYKNITNYQSIDIGTIDELSTRHLKNHQVPVKEQVQQSICEQGIISAEQKVSTHKTQQPMAEVLPDGRLILYPSFFAKHSLHDLVREVTHSVIPQDTVPIGIKNGSLSS